MADLLGHQWKQSEEIKNQIQQLVDTVSSINNKIEFSRVSNPDLGTTNETLMQEVADTRGRPLFYPYMSTGAGRGPYVELEDGSIKMDLINGIGINILGHSHPRVLQAAVTGALEDALMQGNLQPGKQYHALLQKLTDVGKKQSKLKYAWITTCGSMANENALKMARQKNSPRKKIVAMNHAFAGRTTLMAEITDNPNYKVGLPTYNDVLRVDFYDKNNPNSIENSVKQLKKHIDDHPNDIAVFSFEPLQGEGGFNVAPKEFFLPLFELCKEHGIAIWADEVQTFLRTGEVFCVETLGIAEYIDIVTVAKTLQCAATFCTEEYNPKPGLIAGTFAASSPQLAAALEIMNMFTNEGYIGPQGKVQKIHDEFVAMLEDLGNDSCSGLVSDISGLGLMVAFTALDGSSEKRNALLKTLYKNGMIAFGCGHGPYKVRFLLPAILESSDIQHAKEILEKSLLEEK